MFPSSTNMSKILANILVKNAAVSADDMKRSLDLYGENTAIHKGKMTCPSPQQHDTMNLVPLPPQLHDKRIVFYTDLLFVSGLPFLIVISGRLNYMSIISLACKHSYIFSLYES